MEQTENCTGRSKSHVFSNTQIFSLQNFCVTIFCSRFFFYLLLLFFSHLSTIYVSIRVSNVMQIQYDYIANFLLAFWYHFWSMLVVERCAAAVTVAFALSFRHVRLPSQPGSPVVMLSHNATRCIRRS